MNLKLAKLFPLTIILLLTIALNCAAQKPSETGKVSSDTKIVFPHLTLEICESRGRKYEFKVEGDNGTVKASPGEDFGGTILCFDWEKFRSIEAFAKFKFGALQYLFDDTPAAPLNVEMETGWAALELEQQSILIPQTNDDFDGVMTVSEFLNFDDKDAFDVFYEGKYFAKIFEESINKQRDAFGATREPEERKRLKECCPERIERAEDFFRMGGEELGTLKGLSVEPYRVKTTIEIRGETKKGKKFVYLIIDEDERGKPGP